MVTHDGARLTGVITLIDEGVIHLATTYAGDIEIRQEEVETFSTDDPVKVRLAGGNVTSGPVEADAAGKLRIRSGDGVVETESARVASSWRPEDKDPDLLRAEAALEAERMKWSFQAGFEVDGREGSTEEFNIGGNFKAVLGNEDDTLTFTGLYEQREKNDEKTEDRVEGGVSYESFFSEKWGWYVDTRLSRDAIENIDLRSSSSAGLSYRYLNKEHHRLVFQSGLGYRFTSYDDGTDDESDPTLNLGLAHMYRFKERYVVATDLSYQPSLSDFSSYLFTQDTGLEIPVGDSERFKIRIGLKNEYDSETVTDDELDTTYYTRLIVDWK